MSLVDPRCAAFNRRAGALAACHHLSRLFRFCFVLCLIVLFAYTAAAAVCFALLCFVLFSLLLFCFSLFVLFACAV